MTKKGLLQTIPGQAMTPERWDTLLRRAREHGLDLDYTDELTDALATERQRAERAETERDALKVENESLRATGNELCEYAEEHADAGEIGSDVWTCIQGWGYLQDKAWIARYIHKASID
jgi:hypothetical protein